MENDVRPIKVPLDRIDKFLNFDILVSSKMHMII
jgi:hypothetical protein